MLKAVLLVSTILIGISLLVEGDRCMINSKAKMKSFGSSRTSMNLKLPCKFDATTQVCGDYKIHVSTGMAFDKKYKYFTETVFVGIIKHKTEFYWRGYTTNQRLTRYFNGTVDEPYKTKEENRNFDLGITTNEKALSVTMQVGQTKIVYTAYNPKDKLQNGLEITCSVDADYKEGGGVYPESICGNKTDGLRARRKELGLNGKHAVMYDILKNGPNVYQNNPGCGMAMSVFTGCSSEAKVEAVKECSNIMTKSSTLKCQRNNGMVPMETFLLCLKYKCVKNDFDSCGFLKEREDVCANIGVIGKESCPKQGAGDGY